MTMKCSEIMSHKTSWCTPDCTVEDAVQVMKEQNCGAVPIVDEDMHIKGIVTDRDITLFVVLQHKDPKTTPVSDFMNKDVITCYEDETLDELVGKMKMYQVRRIPILDSENKLTGMISLGDIAVKAPFEEHKAYEALERISEPVHG